MKKVSKILALTLVAVFLLSSLCFADNPVVKNIYTADPATLVHNGTVYLYTGHDEGSTGYYMRDWKVYSSTDMKTWTDRGTPLAVSAFSWAKGDAWASQVIYRNEKFYWYLCAEHVNGGKAIGVAVSDSPTGPFVDAIGRALITNDMTKFTNISWDDIDPSVFIDTDGQAYLYWGNTACMYVKLNSDMISYSGSINNVTSQLPDFTEAPWVYKRGSLYYLVYAKGWYEQIAYATSTSPTGPWTYRGIISDYVGNNSNTQHAAIIDFNGSSYYISHNDALPTGGSFRRSVYIEKFNYNTDGTIPYIPMTSTGVNGVKSRIQSYNFQNMYARQQGNVGRIDANVFPAQNQYWQVVPGLANSGSGYVSFQSVYYPGYYLRHSNYELVLAKNDGSSTFAQDATFKQVPGLADGSWSSFQSYNFPDRYLRHSNYVLRIDPISDDLGRQDATFKIVNDGSASISDAYVQIRNRATNINIDGYGYNYSSSGADCNQYSDNTHQNQQWIIESAGSYVKIKNRATGMFLDGMGQTSNGSNCGQYTGNDSNNQKWIQESVGGGYYKFKNVGTGLYLDGMGRTSNGSALGQWSSSSSNNQQWYLETP